MTLSEAQREMRSVYRCAFPGTVVSGVLWLFSAALATWVSHKLGMLGLVFGGALIFPVTQLVLRASGRPATLRPENSLRWLAMQVAFTVPLNLPLAGAAMLYRRDWFYPACMLIVGTHYLPFQFMYGMRQFVVLAVILIVAALALALYVPEGFAHGGWLTGILLVGFALVLRAAALREEGRGA